VRGKRIGFSPKAAARHRGRTRVSMNYSQLPFPLCPTIFHLFSDRTSPHSEIGILQLCLISDFWVRDVTKNWMKRQLKSVETLVRKLCCAAGSRAKDPPLAARPNYGNQPVGGQPECNFSILGGRKLTHYRLSIMNSMKLSPPGGVKCYLYG